MQLLDTLFCFSLKGLSIKLQPHMCEIREACEQISIFALRAAQLWWSLIQIMCDCTLTAVNAGKGREKLEIQ